MTGRLFCRCSVNIYPIATGLEPLDLYFDAQYVTDKLFGQRTKIVSVTENQDFGKKTHGVPAVAPRAKVDSRRDFLGIEPNGTEELIRGKLCRFCPLFCPL